MTHLKYGEKVFIMKKLLLIFVLTLSFQTSVKTSEIKDFELEGLSVGESLLEYFSEANIIKELNSEFAYKYKSDFIRVGAGVGSGFILIKDIKQYDDIGITLKLNDKKLIIYSLSGRIFCDGGIKDCFNTSITLS